MFTIKSILTKTRLLIEAFIQHKPISPDNKLRINELTYLRTYFESLPLEAFLQYLPISPDKFSITELPHLLTYFESLPEGIQNLNPVPQKGLDAYLKKLIMDRTDKGSLEQIIQEVFTAITSVDSSSRSLDDEIPTKSRSQRVRLNYWQKNALRALHQHGLTASALRECGNEFDEHHCFALRHLILKKHLPAEDALDMIDELSSRQARGISNGLTREDVIGLDFWKIAALEQLKEHGLTAEALRAWRKEFGLEHCSALGHLILVTHLSAQDALEMIYGLSSHQARGVENGLTCEDVIGLDFWTISALRQLKAHGLTAEALRAWGIREFDLEHCSALRHLILVNHLSAQDALEMIYGLSPLQAGGIENGLTREQVLAEEDMNRFASDIPHNSSKFQASTIRKRKSQAFTNPHVETFFTQNTVGGPCVKDPDQKISWIKKTQ